MAPESKFPGVSIHLTFTMDPKDKPAFLKQFKDLCAIIAKEEKCTFIETFQSATEPGVVRMIENWCVDNPFFVLMLKLINLPPFVLLLCFSALALNPFLTHHHTGVCP